MAETRIDTKQCHYAITKKDGSVWYQATPFHWVTADWNCDGDVYADFVASFVNSDGNACIYTPADLEDGVNENLFTIAIAKE